MRNSLALMPSAGPVLGPVPESFSPALLAELLALNQEMAEQLCLERLSDVDQADILTRLITQHEKTAQLLRAQLAGYESVALLPREDPGQASPPV